MRRSIWIAMLATAGCAASGGLSGSAPSSGDPAGGATRTESRGTRRTETGVASYYDSRLDGSRTASGQRYDEDALTAAHRTLPFGTRVRVTNLSNDRHVVVTINDRGPFTKGRVIDVSRRAARDLGILRRGTATVRLEVLGS
jgi:rare lipoprotein A